LYTSFSLINKLTENLSFKTNFNYTYHSIPYSNIKNEDIKLTVGLEYSF